jgi:diketogulonate reductase-like aldo/keto reductase
MDYLRLRNGIRLPKKGIGTYKLPAGEETYASVLNALSEGARHIDTSVIYRNEKDVGKAIKDSNIPREEIFVTGKLPPHIKNAKGVRRFFERSLKNLGLTYMDAYIINAPGPFNDLDGDYDEGNVVAYKELEKLYEEELVTAIGVSQFNKHHLKNIIDHCDIIPHINQISYFIGHTQDEIKEYMDEYDIALQAFSPLAKGYILNHPDIINLANKYRKSTAQIALRYNYQKEVASIPKATSILHIEQNNMLGFKISDGDMKLLDKIDNDPRKYDD